MTGLWIQLLTVCLAGACIAACLLPLAGPGRVALCLGLGSILALVATGALMWLMLAGGAPIRSWLPVAVLGVLALAAHGIRRRQPAWCRPAQVATETATATTQPAAADPRWQRVLLVVLLGLIGLRMASLLPDVLLRPLFAWDAWTVWAFEARLWLEQGRFVELLPPGQWLDAPPAAFVRDNLVPYPRLVPALILWAAAGQEAWTGVGPGLLWLVAAGSIALVLFGLLRQVGLARVWALLAAYAWLSLPLVNAHVSLYGYADLWLAALLAVFAAAVVLAERHGRRLWLVVAGLALLGLPLVKLEGLYWLVCGLVALLAVPLGLGVRLLMLLSLAGVAVIYAALGLGLDLVAWLSMGRLEASLASTGLALVSGLRHTLMTYDWHLLGYLLPAAMVVVALRPALADSLRTLVAFGVFGLVVLWGLIPLTGAGDFVAIGTLFSRVLLQLMPALLLMVALLGHGLGQSSVHNSRQRPETGRPAAGSALKPFLAAMAAAGLLGWAALAGWSLTEAGRDQLLPDRVIQPDAVRWRLAEGEGGLSEAGLRVVQPGRFGRVWLAIELSRPVNCPNLGPPVCSNFGMTSVG